MVRFLHTSDWQLGMTRHFFSEGAQERYNQARFDAVRALGKVAKKENCKFVAVCGDAFESNQVDRKTIARAFEALREIPVPVYILPGNHDPLNEASVYFSNAFVQGKPVNVTVVTDATPIQIEEDIQLVGCPWMSKRMALNPFDDAIKSLEPVLGFTRIILAHGIIDLFTPKQDDPGVLVAANLEQIINDKKASFIALGDRHSVTKVGISNRIWYSGTPEVTDFGEDKSGYASVIELEGDSVITKPVQVGQWNFIDRDRIDINSSEDIETLRKMLESLDQKEKTVIKLNLVGSISLSQEAILRQTIDTISEVFASFQLKDDGLLVLPDDADFSGLGFSGFAAATIERLREKTAGEGSEKLAARDALMLVVRLKAGMR